MPKITNEIFIERAKQKHGDKYDYSMTYYKNNKTKVTIICNIHGVFEQFPNDHKNGCGCPACSGLKRITNDIFIKRAQKIHCGKYDYSIIEYINSFTKIEIICDIHGTFKQVPSDHLSGKGCPKCSGKNKTTNEIIEEFTKIHGNKYDYSLVVYKKAQDKIEILCPIHGLFTQKAYSHLQGTGCPDCGGTKRYTTTSFIKKAKEIHGDKYDYSLLTYTLAHNRVKIICPEHGCFEQLPYTHIQGFGCNNCFESKGENEINNLLIQNKIIFERQKTFSNCKDKRMLPFDFYLPKQNICIEFDGVQHFMPIKQFGGESALKKTIKRDKIKTKFCKNANIQLIRIKYDENIFDKLKFLF